ncbi:hypothetical protein Thpro_021255 [Acidihalobacter prosperus]|uniref:YknX-like C-terminal permuted SH3-like domain-containing protein n=1 Tax=Acidihalobacter prosperus TaxID=160660 RepID=A0A1A6C6N3_9GAMM|nr:hypothetical protein Thpro_021255 [Acidihalobacter prosperus]
MLIQTGQVRREALGAMLTVYGQVVPDPEQVTGISAAHGGQVTRLWVGLGQQVTAGQPLLQLATDPTARLAFEQAKAQVAYARKKLAQVKGLFAEQLATRAELAKAEQQLVNARDALRAQRRLGADRATQTLRAPQDAIVTQLNVAPGDRIRAGVALLALGARHRLWVKLGIEPEDVDRLRPGMHVTLQPVFGSAPSFKARLSQVHAVINPATHLVDAIAPLSGQATRNLIPGMWMRGHIALARRTALTVPQTAVLHDARGAYLFVVEPDQHAHRIDVVTGLEARGRVAVSGHGVHAGQTVVTVGNYELRDGLSVRTATPPS